VRRLLPGILLQLEIVAVVAAIGRTVNTTFIPEPIGGV
jgi:hypothetical protein